MAIRHVMFKAASIIFPYLMKIQNSNKIHPLIILYKTKDIIILLMIFEILLEVLT